MPRSVVAKVTPLTHGLDVLRDLAERITIAGTALRVQVRDGQHDLALRPLGLSAVDLDAPALLSVDQRDPMNNVIRFPVEGVRKFGFKRAKRHRESAMEKKGQLSLFEKPTGEVLPLPTGMSAFEEALLLDERGDSAAADAYRKAIDEHDYVADAYCNLAIMQSREGRTVEAFDSFAKSLGHEPRHFESHYNMANLYFEEGDLRLARTHYEIAASIAPEFPNVYFNLGLVHAMSEDLQAAIEALSTYRDLATNDDGRMAEELLATLRRSIEQKPHLS